MYLMQCESSFRRAECGPLLETIGGKEGMRLSHFLRQWKWGEPHRGNVQKWAGPRVSTLIEIQSRVSSALRSESA